jgi:hypothetical protein
VPERLSGLSSSIYPFFGVVHVSPPDVDLGDNDQLVITPSKQIHLNFLANPELGH